MNLAILEIDGITTLVNLEQVRWIQVHDDGSCNMWFSETHQIGVPAKNAKRMIQEFVLAKDRRLDLRQ